MEEIKFNSLKELYMRLKPALSCRVSEIKRYNIPYVKEEDLWNYLKETKWAEARNLTLASMTNDILEIDYIEIDNYLKSRLKDIERNINVDDVNLL